jgi:WD40 repeat protein
VEQDRGAVLGIPVVLPTSPENNLSATLHRLVQQHPGVRVDAVRCEAFLLDLCPEERAAVHLLVLAVKEQIPSHLEARSDPDGARLEEAVWTSLVEELAARLVEVGLRVERARWAVEVWAVALGLRGPWANPGLDELSCGLWKLCRDGGSVEAALGKLGQQFPEAQPQLHALRIAVERGLANRLPVPPEGGAQDDLWRWLEERAKVLQERGVERLLACWAVVALAAARGGLPGAHLDRLRDLSFLWQPGVSFDGEGRLLWHPGGELAVTPLGVTCRRGGRPVWSVDLVSRLRSISPDGRWLALLDQKEDLFLVCLRDGQVNRLETGEAASIREVIFSPDSGRVALVYDVRVVLLSVSGESLGGWPREGQEAVFFDPQGKVCAVTPGGVHPLERRDRPCPLDVTPRGEILQLLPGPVGVLAFSPRGRWLVATLRDGGVRVWDATTGEPLALGALDRLEKIGLFAPKFAAFDPEEGRLLCLRDPERPVLYDLYQDRLLEGPGLSATSPGPVIGLESQESGLVLVVGLHKLVLLDGQLRVLRVDAGFPNQTQGRLGPEGHLAAFSGRGFWLGPSREGDKTLHLQVEAESGVTDAVFCGDKVAVLSGTSAMLLGLDGWRRYKPFAHEAVVQGAAYLAPRKQLVVSAGKRLHFWSTETGLSVASMELKFAMSRIRAHPGGELLALVTPQGVGMLRLSG